MDVEGAQRGVPVTPPSNPAQANSPRSSAPTESAQAMGASGQSVGSRPMTRQDMHQMASLSIVLAGMTDPTTLLTAMQARVRNANEDVNAREMEAGATRAEAAEADKAQRIEKAIEAAKKAVSGMPKWLRKTIGAVLAAVGAVASVFTGGASLALTVIGAVLLTAAQIVEVMVEKGVFKGDAALAMTGVAMALRVAGSVVMTCGAGAATAASDVAVQVAVIASKVADYVSMTVATVNGAIDINNAVRINQATNFRLDAEELGLVVDEANEDVEIAAESLQQVGQTHMRAMRRIQQMVALEGETRVAATAVLA